MQSPNRQLTFQQPQTRVENGSLTQEFNHQNRWFPRDFAVQFLLQKVNSSGLGMPRPYPAGGAVYELEIYPVIYHCQGLDAGLYHYHPLEHELSQVSNLNQNITALLIDASASSGQEEMPQVLLVITARFGRLLSKYESLAYALILKHVGVLYQTLYLVSTAMNLAPCALGAGNSDLWAKVTGIDYYAESSVGEFMLGSN